MTGGVRSAVRRAGFVVAGLVVSLLLAGVVSTLAAGTPDGLEYAARQGCTVDADGEVVDGSCMAQAEREHPLAGSPLADYGWRWADSEALATAVSGSIGVLVTFGIGGGLFWLLRRRRGASAGEE